MVPERLRSLDIFFRFGAFVNLSPESRSERRWTGGGAGTSRLEYHYMTGVISRGMRGNAVPIVEKLPVLRNEMTPLFLDRRVEIF